LTKVSQSFGLHFDVRTNFLTVTGTKLKDVKLGLSFKKKSKNYRLYFDVGTKLLAVIVITTYKIIREIFD